MIEFLEQKGGINSNGLTMEEQKELELLRQQVGEYRQREEEENSFSESDDVFDEDEEKEQEALIEKRLSMKRSTRGAVSAEVWGQYNKKEDFKAKVVPKSEEQREKIKIKLLQSFLFHSLEADDLQIVIDAMEAASFSQGDVVINQGDSGDCLYLVEEGELDCYKNTVTS